MWSALFFGLVGPALAVDCPDGTGPVRTVLLGGLVEDGCATMAGVPHGPSEVRATDGTLRARGAWKDGARDGPWRHYDDAGRSREVGSYAGGARTGTWTTLSAAGAPVATVFHAELGGSAMGQGSPDPRIRWMTARPARVTGADGPQQTASIGAAGTRQPRVSVWGALALRSDAAGVSAIALADGATRFSVAPPDGLRAHPIGSRRFLAAVTGTGMALVVDPDAGHTVRIRTAAGATHVAAVDQDTVWVRDGVGRLAAWSWLDGSVRWQTRRSFGSVPPIYVAGAVLASRGREVSATDAKTGRRRWQARLDSEVLFVVAGREDTVLVGTASGTVERFAGGDGTPLETLAQPAGQILPGTLHDLPSGVLIRGADAVGWLGGETADGFGTPPDMADGLACGGSGSGGLVCRAPRAADSPLLLPELVPAGPVQFVGDLLLVPTLAGMTAVDLAVARSMTDGPDGGLPVVLWPEGGAPIDATVPYDIIHRKGPGSDCSLVDGVIDLGAAPAALPVDDAGGLPSFTVAVPEIEVSWKDGDPDWVLGPQWQGELLDARWEAPYTVWWRPELLAVTPVDASPSAAAALDRLLSCTGPGARFRGQAITLHAGRRTVLEGQLRLQPWPHEVDGLPGCLVDVFLDGEDLGPYRPTDQSGWMDVHLAQLGGTNQPLSVAQGVPFPVGIDDGELLVETLLPGEVERAEFIFDAPVSLALEDAWPTGLDLVLRDGPQAERLRLPADDLRLADVPSHTEWWALSGLVVHQPDDAGPSTLWTQTDCAIPEGSEERPPETPPSPSR